MCVSLTQRPHDLLTEVLQRPNNLFLSAGCYFNLDESGSDDTSDEDELANKVMGEIYQSSGSEGSDHTCSSTEEPNLDTFSLNISSFAGIIQQFEAMLGGWPSRCISNNNNLFIK